MKLLLDEHFSGEIAVQLRRAGWDVAGACEDERLTTLSDEDLLRQAAEAGRLLVTEDAKDFLPIHARFVQANERHSGIVLTSNKKFPRSKTGTGNLIKALKAFAKGRPEEDLRTAIHWL